MDILRKRTKIRRKWVKAFVLYEVADKEEVLLPDFPDSECDSLSEEEYNFALERIEQLFPLEDNDNPQDDTKAIELTKISVAYEKKYSPIKSTFKNPPRQEELVSASPAETRLTRGLRVKPAMTMEQVESLK
jgi:antitoxin component HigA of HigAB toxin-antitoxin module